MNWKQTLITLRDQFAAASVQWPYLRHMMFAARIEDASMLEKPFRRMEQSARLVGAGFDLVQVPSSFRMLNVQHHYTVTSSQHCDCSGLESFQELAEMAADTLLRMPDSIHSIFDPPADPHPDAGIYNALWLGPQWVAINRERLLADKERAAAAGRDVSTFYIPERDCVIWRFGSCPRDLRWCLALHNLAWKIGDAAPFNAERSTWNEKGGRFILSLPAEHWRRTLTASGMWPKPGVDLPLRWMQSELKANPFLASVLAIDLLLDDDRTIATVLTTADHSPDRQGYVDEPVDPSAYLPSSKVYTQYVPIKWELSRKRFRALLDKMPSIKKWYRKKPKSRLSIHLSDWITFVEANPDGPKAAEDDGWCDVREEIEKRKAIRAGIRSEGTSPQVPRQQ